ncbi:hypothetical protein [Vibrio crassostreae]|uniref:hypothetical protein n=1 Tax=Vibrio crassostreae TaxID=246167 RepID=UPI001B30C903|nr:hypothetical protein [Vibrio crassostreae]
MINTQIAFITSSAIAGISEAIDLDLLKERHNVSDVDINEAKVASNNITVKKQTSKSIGSIINFIKSEGVQISELYASQTWSPTNTADYNKNSYTTGTKTSATGSMCHYNCHSNCHSNCHGSRGWR